ncbi:NAD(P)/FAD-dependent oxidoreductase [Actinophytocola algeriensis]|uniref:NADH dehydrogenase FAD-containing subunit n=1 Tax=Actinophytocola algeriensis TaxID=1768010 RepID=A0A7W7VCP7_9PSEU|nr:FAD-dependent oxidoreductase [Actinophytocola algeriensis]MBB4905249.1 NADH dehydrogenase FAD-containing subunit [Actinophytocola algeriensis]MBE1473066.1 NADH dehydrogenase FAD-containing subunit [Actinophytocola algeriensis]
MTTRIVVLGAGYSGQMAARLVARAKDVSVTLVNERDRFVERVRLHQLAAGEDLRAHPLAELLAGTGVRLVVDRATAIDPDGKSVVLAGGDRLPYDTLVYALGSRMDLTAVPGVAEHAHTVAVAEEAERLRARLTDGDVVTVVGGGLTGIEAATELAEQRPALKVRLVADGALGGALSEKGRGHLRRVFTRLGIEVRDEARVAEVRADGVVLAGGEHVRSDVVVWTTGFTVPSLAADAGFAVDGHGRMVVDETLRSTSHPDTYGVGDAAAVRMPGGQELRMACATGLPAAQQAVRALLARRDGKDPKPFRFRYVNQCISLGRRDALVQFVDRYDRPKESVLTGRLAARYKETIVRSAYQAQRHPSIPTSL